MFILYGRKKAVIKRYTDFQHPCTHCDSTNLNVVVYRDYIHLFFLPVLPFGEKNTVMICSKCSNRVRIDSVQSQLEKFTRTHWTLYAGLLLVLAVFASVFISYLFTKHPQPPTVNNPQVGDVYAIQKDESDNTNYYFLRVSRLYGDTVLAYHNNLVYNQPVTGLIDEDFFREEEEMIFTKKELQNMIDNNEIVEVYKNYGDQQGFNRIK